MHQQHHIMQQYIKNNNNKNNTFLYFYSLLIIFILISSCVAKINKNEDDEVQYTVSIKDWPVPTEVRKQVKYNMN